MIAYQCPGSPERIVLADSVLAHLREFRQTAGRHEAGGQLFSSFEAISTINVVSATGPSRHDVRARFRFMPNRWREQAEIKRMHSDGLHYVGDWHTHPQHTPSPSQHDLDSIADCYRKSRKEIGGFLLIIVGLNPFPSGLYVGLTNGDHFYPLTVVDPSECR